MRAVCEDRRSSRKWRRHLAVLSGVSIFAFLHASASTETAIANGDTRSLTFISHHTNETGKFVYKVNGLYDPDVLEKLNWFMRDWRLNEQIKMDTRLFDILWEVYQQSGSSQPIDVLSAYRSPQTNSMLRRRSRLVAEHSQHMEGRAVDAHFVDVGPGPIRDIAMRMQEGGVGFYPIGSTPWVHIDAGTVRYWPRMSRNSLARLFPDGKTVFIPADGQPMDRYADAKAMIESRGGEVQTASSSSSGGLLGWLFGGPRGGGADDDEESGGGARVVVAGRGGSFAPAVSSGRGGAPAILASVAPVEPQKTADTSMTPPPPIVAPQDPVEAVNSDEAPAPSESIEPITPLPPRKPNDLFADLDLPPMPPRRPSELMDALTPKNGAPTANDLIASLIERDALPRAITGVAQKEPKSALALTETGSSRTDSIEALARAARLATPPLPPQRPSSPRDGVTKVVKTQPLPPHSSANGKRPSAANPYGSLVAGAFTSNRSSVVEETSGELRGAAQ